MPSEVQHGRVVRDFPQLDRIVERPAGDQLAVGRDRDCQHQSGVAQHRPRRLQRVRIPQPHALVEAPRHDPLAIRRSRDVINWLRVPNEFHSQNRSDNTDRQRQ